MNVSRENYLRMMTGYESASEDRVAAASGLSSVVRKIMWGQGAKASDFPLWDEPDAKKRRADWPFANNVRKQYLALPIRDDYYRITGYTPAVVRFDEVGHSDSISFYSVWFPHWDRGVLWSNPGQDVVACSVEPLADAKVEVNDGWEAPAIAVLAEWLEYGVKYNPDEFIIDHEGRFTIKNG